MIRKAFVRCAMAAAILVSPSGVGWAQPAQPRRQLMLFDGLLYTGKPDLSAYGMQPARQLNSPHDLSDDPAVPLDEAKVRESMKPLQGYGGAAFLDYESWPLTGQSPQVIRVNVAKFIRVADIARAAVPTARFGFYGVLPCREYWGLVSQDLKQLNRWKECNREGEAIAEHVAVVFPSLYTFYDNPSAWDIYAKGNIEEARRYKKPVYVFLWPQFHPSNVLLRGTYIPAKFWRHQLEVCAGLADGIVIWGGWQETWNEDAPWWVETKSFIASLNRR